MGLFLGLGIIGFLIGCLLIALGVYFDSNCDEILANFTVIIAIFITVLSICFGIAGFTLIGIEGDNKELFLKQQQEYLVITQYMKSNKSDSILESSDMMNRIQKYNNIIIEKQNSMTRPIKKYWAEGADWNQLKLINLEKGE